MPTVHVGLDGTATHIADGATAFDAVGDKARQVVAARVNDMLVDLSHLLQDGDRVEAVLVGEPDGRKPVISPDGRRVAFVSTRPRADSSPARSSTRASKIGFFAAQFSSAAWTVT